MFYWIALYLSLAALGLIAVLGLFSCMRSRSRIAQNRGEEILRLVKIGREYHRYFSRKGVEDVFDAIADQARRLE